ncbi:hypothetical protein PLEOSDRAFT_1100496 [Pleurotus ostreatus PC15]|uniref:Uncharacterized protein n=1 Tax=Pleurotus ostreatus (strain PC15) TaxID=1137138 RepID=A0A067NYC3_PLEO1|nr:hypothetical protein PLEOSDRAFT_1100496 [Pleurotus ostreatus PC15]
MAQADLEDQPARTINTCASNKTAHPGQIICDNTQKHRSSAEVRAANNAKKADKLMKSLIDDQAHHNALDKIAEEEECLFLEDFARHCVAECPDIDVGGESGTNRDVSFQLSKHAMKASKPKKVTSRVVNVSDGKEGGASMSEGPSLPDINAPDFTWEDVEVQEVDSVTVVDVSDTDSQDHEYQPTRDEERSDVEDMDVIAIPEKKTSSTSKGKAAQATSGKRERGVVQADVLAQRERLREATLVGTKWKAQGASTGGSIKDHESGKRAKTTGLGGLRKDWRPPNQLKPEQRSSASHATSRELPTNLNNGLSDHDDNVQTDGEWDADETTDMLEAVRTSKTATVRQAGLQASTQGPGT